MEGGGHYLFEGTYSSIFMNKLRTTTKNHDREATHNLDSKQLLRIKSKVPQMNIICDL